MLASPTDIATALVVGLLSALQGVILYAALEQPKSVGLTLGLVLGGFWIALGLILPRIRRNPWMGVRTPWTLSSDENWAQTHRVAGFTFCIGGALALLCTLSGASALGVVVLLVSALVPAVYSFLLARRLPDA
jgi:immunity protein, SdpI family